MGEERLKGYSFFNFLNSSKIIVLNWYECLKNFRPHASIFQLNIIIIPLK